MDFAFLLTTGKNWKKVKREKSTKTWLENWKTMEHESDGDTNCNWCTRYTYQRIGVRTRGLGNKRTGGDHSIYSIVKIGQDTKKSPGNLRGLAITQTPVKNHQLSLVCKTLKRDNNINLSCRGFYRPSRPQSEYQRKRKERRVLRPCQRTKKVVKN